MAFIRAYRDEDKEDCAFIVSFAPLSLPSSPFSVIRARCSLYYVTHPPYYFPKITD